MLLTNGWEGDRFKSPIWPLLEGLWLSSGASAWHADGPKLNPRHLQQKGSGCCPRLSIQDEPGLEGLMQPKAASCVSPAAWRGGERLSGRLREAQVRRCEEKLEGGERRGPPEVSVGGNGLETRPGAAAAALGAGRRREPGAAAAAASPEGRRESGRKPRATPASARARTRSSRQAPRKQPGDAAAMPRKAPAGEAGPAEGAHRSCGCRFPLLAALLQLALGASVAALGFVAAGGSASLPARDTPYWAGLLLCVVALLGLVLVCISYQPDENTCAQFAIKVTYFLLSALSLVVCVLAVAFAAHCYVQITHFTCGTVLETCQCKLDTEDPLSRTFIFQDVSDCPDFLGTLRIYLLIQMVLNLLAALVGFAACFVMWKDRYQVFYVGVRLHPSTASGAQQQKV
ncbi:sarcospan [Eublepharis macularius]|uniref:Sarcospan n=1 Tax=Eublepharis macularius TaxID=481883 RepID=A0AA97L8U2_EUBMA|nr:sarcospan [Eublepharis macularius]